MTDDMNDLPGDPLLAANARLRDAAAALAAAKRFGERSDAATHAMIAVAHGVAATAVHLGRIADWIESIQLEGGDTDPTADPTADEPTVQCNFCGQPARGTAVATSVDTQTLEEYSSCGQRGCGSRFRLFERSEP